MFIGCFGSQGAKVACGTQGFHKVRVLESIWGLWYPNVAEWLIIFDAFGSEQGERVAETQYTIFYYGK